MHTKQHLLLALFIGSVIQGAVPNVSAAVVALWRFENAGASQADSTVNGNTATATNGAAQVFDIARSSGAMSFDGFDDFLQAADSASLSLTGDLTIALWVNLTSVGGFGQWRGLVTKDPPGSGTAGPYQFWFNQNDGAPVYVGGDGSVNDIAAPVGGSGPSTGVWQHWAVTLSGNNVAMYRDGVALTMGADSTITSPRSDGNGPLFIGHRDGAQDMSFFGRMDDVAIFNHALSGAEITTIMGGDFSAYGIPEPSRALLIGLGLIGVMFRRRR